MIIGRPLVALDMDRTLIYSRAAAHGIADTDICVEHYRDQPLSYLSAEAVDYLRELDEIATIVPTTTRTIEQFARIALPDNIVRTAITSNGGNIVCDGAADIHWRAQVESAISPSASVHTVHEFLTEHADAAWLQTVRVADELFCYVVVELDLLPDGQVDIWHRWAQTHGWNASRQGRKIYLVPDALTKFAAVREVARREQASVIYAAGDGVLDMSMLCGAERALRPSHGELADLGWSIPSLTVTHASGIDAAAEILRTLLSWCRGKPEHMTSQK